MQGIGQNQRRRICLAGPHFVVRGDDGRRHKIGMHNRLASLDFAQGHVGLHVDTMEDA